MGDYGVEFGIISSFSAASNLPHSTPTAFAHLANRLSGRPDDPPTPPFAAKGDCPARIWDGAGS